MLYNKEKIAAILLLVLLVASIVPVIVLGRYNHPTGDDYYYGAETHRVWEETHSVIQAAVEAVRGAVYDYHTWQGTYSAMVLMRLQPTVFSEAAYQWVTCVIVLLLTGGFFYLLYSVICLLLQGSFWCWMASASLLSLLAVQTVPTPAESMFWYNGSMYYTGYLAVTLFLWGLIIRFLKRPRIYEVPVMMLLGLFLAGGNYISLLPCMILLVLLTVGLWVRTAMWKQTEKLTAIGISMVTLAVLVGFAVNALAPGNSVRQSDMWKIPAWKAVLKSLLQGIRYLDAWMGKWWLVTALVMTPFLWKMIKKTSFRFRHPILTLGMMYGIFCSMSCPTFYTMNSTGPARAVAVCYYGFILFSFAGYTYLMGYFYQKLFAQSEERLRKGEPVVRIAAVFLLLGLLAMQTVGGRLAGCTTAKALMLFKDGEPQAYQEEYLRRLAILTDESVEEAVLAPYTHQPEMLYVGDLGSDPTEPANRKVALFYGKKSVAVYCAD